MPDMPHGSAPGTLRQVAAALRRREVSALELAEAAIRRHVDTGNSLDAYKVFDADGARRLARNADERLATESAPPPFCGIPVSVKDLYGMEGHPVFAGTSRRLPSSWETDAWLVRRLREQGAVFMGKTHTVELAFGGVGTNPHWTTPRNPWDAVTHRIPGGSSSGAGVSLGVGSALLALGTDTAGSIRIPASMTGNVGQRITHGRWPTHGVVPLSPRSDTVGGLTRSVDDAVFFFGAIDPAWGEPEALLERLLREDLAHLPLERASGDGIRVAVPDCSIWSDCQGDIADVLRTALDELSAAGWKRVDTDGRLLDRAVSQYLSDGVAGAECARFLETDLQGWREIIHPIVAARLDASPAVDSDAYSRALLLRDELISGAVTLFEEADVLALPTAIITPPPVSEVSDPLAYGSVNRAVLRPTCPASLLGLCAITLPVGRDAAGMPVGLQLVARGGGDERLLAMALAAERALGSGRDRMGTPPGV